MALIEVSNDSEASNDGNASGEIASIVLLSSADVPVEYNPDATITYMCNSTTNKLYCTVYK